MSSPTSTARRVSIDHDPFVDAPGVDGTAPDQRSWNARAHWPAHWIGLHDQPAAPFVAGYRLAFTVDESETASAAGSTVRLHASADERYELYLDGQRIGRGPDRGDVEHWHFETYDVTLPAGPHWLAARVWSIGDEAPYAQFSLGHAFLLAADGRPDLSTGTGDWQAAVLPGHGFRDRGVAWGCGLKLELDGRRYPWGWQQGGDALAWATAGDAGQAFAHRFANDMPPTRMLVPALLPPQWEAPAAAGTIRLVADYPGGDTHDIPIRAADSIAAEAEQWQALLAGTPLTVPAHTRRRVLLDLDTYVCGYPMLRLQGGRDAVVRVHWQEALFDADGHKGNRDEIEGKRFRSIGRPVDGVGDLFIAGGGDETHTSLWWEAGRYVEITVQTEANPLTIAELRFEENRYPYELASSFSASDPRLAQVQRLGFRTLQMCSHETTMDCPFYEQLQYAGDTRLQCLVAYVSADDDRLARQALLAFDRSRATDGLTRSRYPSRVRQTIPPFSLWWVTMVHDFALWRGDLDFVRGLMPGVRAVLDAYRANVDESGLFHALDGWNFTDWVADWKAGAPPAAHWGVSGILNFQLAYTAGLAAELEDWLAEPELAARHRGLAGRVRGAAEQRFFAPDRGLYADDTDHQHWSEHAQCLALLAGAEHGADAVARTLASDDPATAQLARTTVYFDHYLFEALGRIGRVDALQDRLGLWFDLLDSGLKTVVEMPEPTRSDCHAWGAHPIFHLYATILGVRPVAPGMRAVAVRPQLGGLQWAEGTLPTPHGPLHVRVDAGGTSVDLPAGVEQVVD